MRMRPPPPTEGSTRLAVGTTAATCALAEQNTAWPPACPVPTRLLVRVCIVIRSGRAGAAESNRVAGGCVSPPRACANSRQGWRADRPSQLRCAQGAPSRCCPGSPPRFGAGGCLRNGKWSRTRGGGAATAKCRHPCRPRPEQCSRLDSCWFPPIPQHPASWRCPLSGLWGPT